MVRAPTKRPSVQILRARLGLYERYGVDEHRLIGDELSRHSQICKRRAGRNAGFQWPSSLCQPLAAEAEGHLRANPDEVSLSLNPRFNDMSRGYIHSVDMSQDRVDEIRMWSLAQLYPSSPAEVGGEVLHLLAAARVVFSP
jgi:hypothetical protein